MLHSISFDVEEYFQVANLQAAFPRESWAAVDSRLAVGMDAILSALDRHRARATFFWLGWVAERHPALVRRCLAAGHEIASHGYEHRFLTDMDPASFARDLELTEQALMAAGAPRPIGFRASTFTLVKRTWWAFDVLAARGYVYDSSVHPVRHPVYGVPGFAPGISCVSVQDGARVVEFPVSTYTVLGRNVPVGGGGYFRLLPGALSRAALRSIARERPLCFYLHPWEFDPAQPRVDAPWSKRWRHYLNLDRTLPRLEALLAALPFGTLREVLTEQGWLDAAGSLRARP